MKLSHRQAGKRRHPRQFTIRLRDTEGQRDNFYDYDHGLPAIIKIGCRLIERIERPNFDLLIMEMPEPGTVVNPEDVTKILTDEQIVERVRQTYCHTSL